VNWYVHGVGTRGSDPPERAPQASRLVSGAMAAYIATRWALGFRLRQFSRQNEPALIRDARARAPDAVVAIGSFDGVHLGHRPPRECGREGPGAGSPPPSHHRAPAP